MENYIALPSAFYEWQWFSEPCTCHIFIALLLKATKHDTKSPQGIDIKRGQVVITLYSFSDFCGCSIKQIRTAFKRLKECGYIVTQPTNKYTLITICNYDCYRIAEDTE